MMNNYSGSEFEGSILKMMQEFGLEDAEDLRGQLCSYAQAAGCANLYSKLSAAKKAGKLSCGANAWMDDIMNVSAGQGEDKIAAYMDLFGIPAAGRKKKCGAKIDEKIDLADRLCDEEAPDINIPIVENVEGLGAMPARKRK